MALVDKPSARETKRMQTRERLMGAAIAEFKRSGIAAADVGAIVAAKRNGLPSNSPDMRVPRAISPPHSTKRFDW